MMKTLVNLDFEVLVFVQVNVVGGFLKQLYEKLFQRLFLCLEHSQIVLLCNDQTNYQLQRYH